jgi:hypothetical protein
MAAKHMSTDLQERYVQGLYFDNSPSSLPMADIVVAPTSFASNLLKKMRGSAETTSERKAVSVTAQPAPLPLRQARFDD